MAILNENGYTKSTPEEIKEALVEKIKQRIPEFEELDADIQNNLLDTSITGLLYYENMVAVLLNSFAIDYSCQDLFLKQAEELGLRRKNSFRAKAKIEFTGSPGDLIPKGTKVGWVDDISFYFETMKTHVIGSTGKVEVEAYGEANRAFEPHTIQKIITVLDEGIGATNNEYTMASINEEDFNEFKLRSQARLRSPRMGGKVYADTQMKAIDGVDPRLVVFYTKDYTTSYEDELGQTIWTHVKGIEAVIGGGDDYEIANALYHSFFETQKLISEPSGKDDADKAKRKKQIDLFLYNNKVQVQFTRPKKIDLNLKFFITFDGNYVSAASIQGATIGSVQNYINGLKVGTNVSMYAIFDLVNKDLAKLGIPSSAITFTTMKYAIGYYEDTSKIQWLELNQENLIPEVAHDTYYELREWAVGFNL